MTGRAAAVRRSQSARSLRGACRDTAVAPLASGPYRPLLVGVDRRVGHRGMALPCAVMLAAMMLTTSAAWLEASIAHRRYGANVQEHLRATQAADGALVLCARDLKAGVAPVLPAASRAPEQWTRAETFEGAFAYEPAPSWPGSARAPQCVIEAALVEGDAEGRAYWVTARGFGASESAQAWLQLVIVYEAGAERRAWRRIVAVPRAS